ncbi:THUMP domain-containing protein 1 [Choanephora cucurbitarum]|uniref:THUMP domain-containing protein 1 n=1 Tax=Choanephora cucurbitarum TaxID=101091 RepID=A0A1C7N5S2_9FUNG|nr:THUMP domain-containing protein 1 [Choanephora cucurbitarum]
MTDQDKKRQSESIQDEKNKKHKKEAATIPILRGRFKQRWLTKHSHLLKRSDDANGILVSCSVNAETRALGQVSNCLEHYITLLFPDHQSTWTRFEGKLDIDQIDFEEEEENKDQKDKEEEQKGERKEKKFQAIDAACGGLVFYRFRINVKPTEFVIRLMDHLKQLPDKEREQELNKIRHCARWVPLDYICPAITERIASCFERVRKDYFSDDDKSTDETVAILTEIRNNIMITKDDIIKTIAPSIPPKYKVNLKNPTYVILVTVFKSACGIAVLRDYYERKKYNLVSFCQ